MRTEASSVGPFLSVENLAFEDNSRYLHTYMPGYPRRGRREGVVKQTPANQPTSRPADPPQSAPVCIMRTAANFAGDGEEGCVRFVRVHSHARCRGSSGAESFSTTHGLRATATDPTTTRDRYIDRYLEGGGGTGGLRLSENGHPSIPLLLLLLLLSSPATSIPPHHRPVGRLVGRSGQAHAEPLDGRHRLPGSVEPHLMYLPCSFLPARSARM